MSEIKKFADAVLAIGGQNGVAMVKDYGSQLQVDIDGFDIVAFKQNVALAVFGHGLIGRGLLLS